MRANLRGEGGLFSWGFPAWYKVLELADLYGWERTGTVAPASVLTGLGGPCPWDATYETTEGQLVLGEDAANLSTALARALADVPLREPPHRRVLIEVGAIHVVMDDPALDPVLFFGGLEYRDRLRRFVTYAAAGAFEIR